MDRARALSDGGAGREGWGTISCSKEGQFVAESPVLMNASARKSEA